MCVCLCARSCACVHACMCWFEKHTCTWTCVYMPQHECGSQRTTFKSQLTPFTMWTQETHLGLADLVVSISTYSALSLARSREKVKISSMLFLNEVSKTMTPKRNCWPALPPKHQFKMLVKDITQVGRLNQQTFAGYGSRLGSPEARNRQIKGS